jgi:peptidoglycan/LPS O-acetylase OafA/YrhL
MQRESRFIFLDGLRGIAALTVAVLHASQGFNIGYTPRHATLAVDFFFCLSGFIIASAYDKKLTSGMRLGDFVTRRLIRLYPMILVSVLLGGALTILKAFVAPTWTVNDAVLLTASTLFLLPLGLAYGQQAYPVNNPIWSLFFEVFISVMYGVFGSRITRAISFYALAILAATLLAIIFVSSGIDLVGYANSRDFVFGFVRVAFPFLVGVVIYREIWSKFNLRTTGWTGAGIAAALCFMLLDWHISPSPVYDSICILFLIPLIIVLGSSVSACSPRVSQLLSWLGAISYPFYLVHQPVLRIFMRVSERYSRFAGHGLMLAIVALLASVVLAHVLLEVYDVPVRKWVARRMAMRLIPRGATLE